MKQIIIVEPKSLTLKDKEKLSKSGFIVIEHSNPDAVRIITPMNEANSSSILMAAMEAVNKESYSHSHFAKALTKRILSQEQVIDAPDTTHIVD
jgi:hypothetical protein